MFETYQLQLSMTNLEEFEAIVKEIPDDFQPPRSIFVRVKDYVWNKVKEGYSLFQSHVWPTMTAIMTTYMVLTPILSSIRVNNEDELIMAIARGYGIGRSGRNVPIDMYADEPDPPRQEFSPFMYSGQRKGEMLKAVLGKQGNEAISPLANFLEESSKVTKGKIPSIVQMMQKPEVDSKDQQEQQNQQQTEKKTTAN